MTYSDKHKIVLQSIMHQGALEEDHGKQLINDLFGHNDVTQVLNKINAKLQPLNMTIKYINCEVTGQLYWVVANTVQDITARFTLEYSEAELAFLRNIYYTIITSDEGYVSSTWCLNSCSSLNIKLSKDNAQKFLHDMVEKKWLSCKNGRYYIGVRSIAELSQYFKDSHEDNLHFCTLCKQIVYYGEKCNQCNTVIHIYCLNTYTTGRTDLGCPNCHHSISQPDSDDHDITIDTEEEISRKETQITRRKGLKRKH